MKTEWEVGEAYVIEDIDKLFEELGERAEEYTFIVDDNGGDPDGSAYLIDVEDVKEQDEAVFEKHCKKVRALIVYNYDYDLRDLLRESIRDFDDRVQWWGNQTLEKAIFVIEHF